MSDFLFCTAPRRPGVLKEALELYLAPVTESCVEYHGEWGSLAVALAAHDSPAVREDERFLTVVIAGPRAGTASALATADALLRTDAVREWDAALDGPFAALGVHKSTGAGAVATDLAAFVTVFAADRRDGAGVVLGTHADAVARAAGRNRDLDLVSAADLVTNLSNTFPYTLYHGVTQLAPASVVRFESGALRPASSYWLPLEQLEYESPGEAASALREAFAADVASVCRDLPRVGLLLSGGEDARAVLGAVPAGSTVRAFTFADWDNREVRVARRVAEAYGAEFVFGHRRPDHYMEAFPVVAALVGSGNMFIDVHTFGFHERLGLRDLPVVLGGLSSDSFLKAHHAPGRGGSDQPFQGPRLPLLQPELVQAVAERRTSFRRWLGEMRPDSAREWERIWPFSMRKHGANLHGNRRLFASHEPYHSNGVVKIAAAVPLEWKYRRKLFHAAMRPFLRKSWYIPHGEYRFPYFGRYANVPLSAALRVTRGVRAVLKGEALARQGSWPKWRRVIASETMRKRRDEHLLLESPLRGILTSASREEVDSAMQRHWHPHRQILLLQLVYLARLAEGAAVD